MIIGDALDQAASRLSERAVGDPRREAILLLSFVASRDKAFIYAHPEFELDPEASEKFEEAVRRRCNREPLQYIRGRQEFFGMNFTVSPDVLIPRPETEILVEEALRRIPANSRICDVGTGSGCIAIAILASRPDISAVATDISSAAIRVAQSNAVDLGVAERFTAVRSDVFDVLDPGLSFNAVLSNPPYVPECDIETLQAEVRDHEPYEALSGGTDGLSIVTRIVSEAPRRLCPSGLLFLEFGFDQSEKVNRLFDRGVWTEPEFFPDLQGIPRMVAVALR